VIIRLLALSMVILVVYAFSFPVLIKFLNIHMRQNMEYLVGALDYILRLACHILHIYFDSIFLNNHSDQIIFFFLTGS
jgi:hypothetical protein